jgi:integrase
MNLIDDFIKDKEYRTQKNYRWILNQFFREIKQKPDTYFKKERDFQSDIEEWWKQHIDEVPKTRNTKLTIIKGFMEENDIPINTKFWKKLRKQKKGTRAATLDRVPSEAEFKRILRHGDIKDKALFLFTMSSGMRIDEVLKITPEMMDLEQDPPVISLPGKITKNGDPRITFITPEAKEYLQEWLKIRSKWLKRSIKRTSHLCNKDPNDNRIFPFSYDVAWTRWIYLLKKTGLDKKDSTTKRFELHIHCLRKYFLSQMKLEIPAVIPEALAGHEQYLDEAYRRYSRKQLADYYKKAESRITVLESKTDLSEVQEQLIEKDREIQDLQRQIDDMNNKMLQLLIENNKNEIEKLKNK